MTVERSEAVIPDLIRDPDGEGASLVSGPRLKAGATEATL